MYKESLVINFPRDLAYLENLYGEYLIDMENLQIFFSQLKVDKDAQKLYFKDIHCKGSLLMKTKLSDIEFNLEEKLFHYIKTNFEFYQKL